MSEMKDVHVDLKITDHQGHEGLTVHHSIRDECLTRKKAIQKLRRVIELLQVTDQKKSKAV